jgi:hypothetical protein
MDYLILLLFTPLGSFRRVPKITEASTNNKNKSQEEAIAVAGFRVGH